MRPPYPTTAITEPLGPFSTRAVQYWRVAQYAVWVVGFIILGALLFFPALGINLMWNILIPVAPLLLVVAAGVWRNICPLATTSLLPRQLGISKKKKISADQQVRLQLTGIIALFVIVPLRHAIFNTDGWATGALLICVSCLAVYMGYQYEWKSGWCSGLCPVHPVEKLYSSKVLFSVPNSNCTNCANCMAPCPDSTPGIHPHSVKKTLAHRVGGFLMIGAFPGFIWGWFHVPDFHGIDTLEQLIQMYAFPFLGAIVSLLLYFAASALLTKQHERVLISIFAAASVSCYYWYRIPALVGFGLFPDNGVLVNLRGAIPDWAPTLFAAGMVLFFFWWLVIRPQGKRSWTVRPEFE